VIRLLASSPLATLKIEGLAPPSRETRGAESVFEDRHKVTARGHLRKERSYRKKVEGVEFSCREDRRGLRVLSDPISILFLI
jgi:hypothetical protein